MAENDWRYVVINGDGIPGDNNKRLVQMSDTIHDHLPGIDANEVYLYGGLDYDISFYYRSSQQLGVWIAYTDGYRTMVDNAVPTNTGNAQLRTYNFVKYDRSRVITGLFFGWSQLGGDQTKWAEIDKVEMHVSSVGGNTLIPNGDGVGTTDWVNAVNGLAQYWTSGVTGNATMVFEVKIGPADGFDESNYQYFETHQVGACTSAIYSQFTG